MPSLSPRFRTLAIVPALVASVFTISSHAIRQDAPSRATHLQVPDGFTIERIAGPELLSYPMFAVHDDRGRLFVFESTEPNTMTTEEMLATPSYHIRVLEDVDGDGTYDKSTMYADKLPFPKGGALVDGSLFVSAAPDLLRFKDTDGDLVADEREVVLTGWTLNVNGAAMGGPFLGPDGWLYITDARRGFRITRKEGDTLEGKGARIWRVRPDGSGLEWIAGGGFDNATEIAFMPSGDAIGTMTYFLDPRDGLRDALMHWVEGGVYPKPHESVAADGLPLTGDYLPPMTMLARVAPSGVMRYRGEAFGDGFHGNLFSAQFNTGRIMRHIVTPHGATYQSEDLPFMTATTADSHPTDVLQDADGSLIVIETGGWFIKGCPLSRVAKPDVAGGIYRIRRTGAPSVSHPRGLDVPFETLTPARLGGLLADRRPVVRDRAIDALVRAGDAAVGALADARRLASDVETRAGAVFALHRIGTPAAREAVRDALGDRNPDVRVAAARSVGLARDAAALPALLRVVVTDAPAVRRQAATALEQIGQPEAVPALLKAAQDPADRFVEHAVIHALIGLRQPAPLVTALQSASHAERRAALIALDQMPGTDPATRPHLRQEHVRPFLASRDEALWRTGIWVASHHPGWSDLIVTGVRARLDAPTLTDADGAMLRDVMVSVCRDDDVQRLIAADASGVRAAIVSEVIRSCPVAKMPPIWVEALRRQMASTDAEVRARAIRLVAARRIEALAGDLALMVADSSLPQSQRFEAMDALILVRPGIDEPTFGWLTSRLDASQPAPVRQQAAGVLAQGALTDAQLVALAERQLANADAFVLPRLVAAFDRSTSEQVGDALVKALARSTDRLDVLSEPDLAARLAKFPEPVGRSAAPLMLALRQRQNARLKRLESIDGGLGRGDIDAGRRLFFGKATCSTCHAVGQQGATFGPDLSNIGEIRSRHDILEAILYPSASFAREYETWRVRTKSGENTGVIKEQSTDAIVIETGPGASVRMPREAIVAVEPVEFSAMPPGLEQILSAAELADLMAYLEALPDPFDRRKRM
ncbi:MAG: HEAT repeat domain-containing protein [Acidobacteria bacterium]|nr:HEAT repeat domain-containing protein [Acidobacteriota bacterium]